MVQHKTSVILVVVVLLNINTKAFAQPPDFNHARQLIADAPRPINYDQLCIAQPSGGDKVACRLRGAPRVTFLVCKTSTLEGNPCKDVIKDEIGFLDRVKSGGVRTVLVNPPQIDGVTCANNPADQTCSGFLEEWVGLDIGQFKHIRDRIDAKTIPALIQEVKAFTPKAFLKTTADNLKAIKTYMEAPPTKYRQICDLQGFFLNQGGFLVNDVPYILENASLTGECWDGEPTTQEVLTALDTMIAGFLQP